MLVTCDVHVGCFLPTIRRDIIHIDTRVGVVLVEDLAARDEDKLVLEEGQAGPFARSWRLLFQALIDSFDTIFAKRAVEALEQE